MLRKVFNSLLATYLQDPSICEKLWSELYSNYTHSSRHYHNISHLEDLFEQLQPIKERISNWQILLFTLFYHDVIYKSTKKNNEEKSAELARLRLREIGVHEEDIRFCFNQILATKHHQRSLHLDTNYFTDADLSILGRDSETYKVYCENVRKEYWIYPYFIYRKGRKKVVQHFLDMPNIFKTEYFQHLYEKQAVINLEQELLLL